MRGSIGDRVVRDIIVQEAIFRRTSRLAITIRSVTVSNKGIGYLPSISALQGSCAASCEIHVTPACQDSALCLMAYALSQRVAKHSKIQQNVERSQTRRKKTGHFY